MTTMTNKLFDVLARIYNADASKNNGLFNGEAVLCRAFSLEAADALIAAGGITSTSGYFTGFRGAIETKPIKALQLALDCLRYCRARHRDAQSGEGVPAEIIIENAIEQATAEAVAAKALLNALRRWLIWSDANHPDHADFATGMAEDFAARKEIPSHQRVVEMLQKEAAAAIAAAEAAL